MLEKRPSFPLLKNSFVSNRGASGSSRGDEDWQKGQGTGNRNSPTDAQTGESLEIISNSEFVESRLSFLAGRVPGMVDDSAG